MSKRQIFVRGYKAGYKKALKESAYASGGWHANATAAREEGIKLRAAAEKYGQPSGGEVDVIEIPVHVEYGIKIRRALATSQGRNYPMMRLTSQGMFIKGLGDSGWASNGHYEKCISEYFYDPQLAGLRSDEEAAILKCNNHGYPRFLIRPVYNFMTENNLHENMHNPGYKMSHVLAKYAVMVINNMLKQIPEGKGTIDFVIKVPYRVGRDNVYSKIFYINEQDFAEYADDIELA